MTEGQRPAVWFPAVRAGTGADVFTQRLCDALNARGIRAEITWLPLRAEYAPWTVPMPQPPPWATVAHVNSWLARRFWPKGLPVVVTVLHLVHDPAYRPFRSPAQAMYHQALIRRREYRAIRDAVAVTTISDYVRTTVEAFSPRRPIKVIPAWIDCGEFSPGPDRAAGPAGAFRLFMAGSHSRRKGFDLLPAFVAALGPGFVIRYAGGRANNAAGIAGVTELGRISEDALIHEYRQCDAVVSLSRYEGFGYTAAEAMACGKPLLGFATSALNEVVGADCGKLVRVDDIAALAAAAHDLRARPAETCALGQNGRGRVLEHFSPGNVKDYIDLYGSLLAKRAGHEALR